MKLYDCITYFNENDLLWLRLNELKPLNPIHIIVEASHTHTGDPKEFNFDEKRFAGFNVRYIKVYDLPNNGDAWANENFQRDCIIKGLYDAEDDDVIIVSDLDEIPRWQAIQYYIPIMGTSSLQMDKMSYYLNCIEGYQSWGIAKITTWKLLKQTTPNKLRNGGSGYSIYYAGWHMSFMGGLDKMIEKFYAYAHTESVTAELMSNLKFKFETGQSLWGDDFWRFVKIDNTFPKYLQDNISEFGHLIKKV